MRLDSAAWRAQLQAREERLLAVLGRGGQVDGVLTLAVVVVERQRTGHGFAVAGTVGHRDHRPVEADHHGGDGHLQRWQHVLPGLLFRRGDAAHVVGDVLDIGARNLAGVILLQVRLHRAHIELGVLVTELAGKTWGGATDDPGLALQRTVDAPAARGLIDVALDLDLAIGALVDLRMATADGQLGLADANRAPSVSKSSIGRLQSPLSPAGCHSGARIDGSRAGTTHPVHGTNTLGGHGTHSQPLSPNEFFARRAEFYWLDYGQTIDRWSAVFGNEHVIVRVFEVGQILSSLQEDFCQSCGIDSAQLTCGDRVDNASTPASALALLRRLALFDKDSDRRWVITQTVADVYAGRAQGTPSDAFTGEQHCQILAELGASNAKVAREYLGRPDGVLFRAPGPEPSSFPVASDLPEVPALCRDILAPVLHKLAVRLTGNEELVSQAAALEVAQIASRALRDGLRSSNAELAREGLVVPASLRPIGNTRNSGF